MDDIKEMPIESVSKAADEGDAFAQYELSRRYEDGICGVKKNMGLAFDWCRKAAEQNHAAAQRTLGFYHVTGRGTDKNYLAAAEWYTKSAMQGDQDASTLLFNLANFLVVSGSNAEMNKFNEITEPVRRVVGLPSLPILHKSADGHTLH